jgi:hypothetical protein
VRSTEESLCPFGLLTWPFFRGRRQGRQPLIYIYSPGQWPRKTWPSNFDDQDLLLLDRYLLLLGPCGWHSVSNQLRSVFWLVSVSILMALSCIMESFLVIYDISCVYDHVWQLYMREIFPNNPAGNKINFRIKYFPSPTKFPICGLLFGTPHYFIIGNPGPVWSVRGQNC